MFTIHLMDGSSEKKLSSEKSYLQSKFWAEFKSMHGWQYKQFAVLYDESTEFVLTVLLKFLKPFGYLAYVPMGPQIFTGEDFLASDTAEKCGTFLTELAAAIMQYLPANVFMFRFDPPWQTSVSNAEGKACSQPPVFPLMPVSKHSRLAVKKAPIDVQPPDSVVIDLTEPEEKISKQLKSKWRYNIGLAQKKGVAVRCIKRGEAVSEALDCFYNLYLETAKRDGIAIHNKDYYASLLKLSENSNGVDVSIYIAEAGRKPLAAIITLFCGGEAVYLYGASSNENRNLMATYALQWQALCDAKKAGCRIYDLYGIPPFENPKHPMYGLYRFKTGFGGNIIHRAGSLDIPVKPLHYTVYRSAEKLRSFWFKKIKKLFRKYHKKLRRK